MIKNFYEHKPANGVKPTSMVILLHGLGSNGRDLISLAPEYAKGLPETIFISPDAPFNCDMAPMGYQWFSLQEWTPESMLRGVEQAAPLLQEFITDQLESNNLPASKLALVGFSQGTMMSLYAGPRLADKIAGILGYSGAMIGPVPTAHKPPVHLIHGGSDTVVPVMAYHHARSALMGGGFTVTGHMTPWLMHSIDPHGIESGKDFLKAVLTA